MARILVIDDEIEVRSVLRRALERAGHEVREAADGAVGVRMFRAIPTDLVITNILMPEKEGIETIRELKQDYPQLGIIAISGYVKGRHNYLETARRFGAAKTFAKPLKLEELTEAVAKLLESPPAQNSSS